MGANESLVNAYFIIVSRFYMKSGNKGYMQLELVNIDFTTFLFLKVYKNSMFLYGFPLKFPPKNVAL